MNYLVRTFFLLLFLTLHRAMTLDAAANVLCYSENVTKNNENGLSDEQLKKIDENTPHFIMEALKIVVLIEDLGKEIYKKLEVWCDTCKSHPLNCAELTGHLSSQQDQKSIDELKIILTKKNSNEILAVMIKIANEKQIACAMCKKFSEWI